MRKDDGRELLLRHVLGHVEEQRQHEGRHREVLELYHQRRNDLLLYDARRKVGQQRQEALEEAGLGGFVLLHQSAEEGDRANVDVVVVGAL